MTTAVKSGSFNTGSLAPGASALLKVEITAKTKSRNKKSNLLVTGKSVTDPGSTDTIKILAKSK
ncbi:hypothetical protein D3C83_299000 [compost metagenome]